MSRKIVIELTEDEYLTAQALSFLDGQATDPRRVRKTLRAIVVAQLEEAATHPNVVGVKSAVERFRRRKRIGMDVVNGGRS